MPQSEWFLAFPAVAEAEACLARVYEETLHVHRLPHFGATFSCIVFSP